MPDETPPGKGTATTGSPGPASPNSTKIRRSAAGSCERSTWGIAPDYGRAPVHPCQRLGRRLPAQGLEKGLQPPGQHIGTKAVQVDLVTPQRGRGHVIA